MTNLEKWRCYLRDCASPDSFINMGFYGMISSALQRRVWTGSEERPLFPNMYIIMVGDPGVGKTMVLDPIVQCLKYHKLPSPHEMRKDLRPTKIVNPEEQNAILQDQGSEVVEGKSLEPKLIIPIGADCTTFEQLIRDHVNAIRRTALGKKTKLAPSGVYTHSTLCFVLGEISSLFHKEADKVVNYLIKVFDCGDYDYKTKHNGQDILRKSCLNFLGGTTPSFMEETFNDKLINDGFAARTVFVFESAARFNRFTIPKETEEQLRCKQDVINHIGALSKLYGQVEYEPDAFEVFRQYIEDELPNRRVNSNVKLNGYYSRKNIHIQKLAMAIHFAERTDLVLTKEDCEMSLAILENLETRMHFAMNFKGSNPLAMVSKKILKYLNIEGPKTAKEIWVSHYEDLRQETEVREVIRHLIATKHIEADETKSPTIYISVAYREKVIREMQKYKDRADNKDTIIVKPPEPPPENVVPMEEPKTTPPNEEGDNSVSL